MQKAALLRKMGRDDEALTVYQAASDLARANLLRRLRRNDFAFNHASRIHKYMR